ncbi:Dynein light chain 2B [Phytophthora cinnamomi]|uniref:Dynein light chain 2B n=1 Tax=Phytophthora cinnamomi TaxID=4785 RepID=UPI00355A3E43|nr:Dynein light chain 2B [Phytophthora cinnamomi]
MAAAAPNEVEEVIKQLKSKPGFSSYILMNNDGIVVKYENLEYKEAIMHAYHVLSLYGRTKKHLQKLFPDPSDSEIEWLRLRTKMHEMIIAQHLRFTLVVLQQAEATDTTPEPIGRGGVVEEAANGAKEEEKPVVAT